VIVPERHQSFLTAITAPASALHSSKLVTRCPQALVPSLWWKGLLLCYREGIVVLFWPTSVCGHSSITCPPRRMASQTRRKQSESAAVRISFRMTDSAQISLGIRRQANHAFCPYHLEENAVSSKFGPNGPPLSVKEEIRIPDLSPVSRQHDLHPGVSLCPSSYSLENRVHAQAGKLLPFPVRTRIPAKNKSQTFTFLWERTLGSLQRL